MELGQITWTSASNLANMIRHQLITNRPRDESFSFANKRSGTQFALSSLKCVNVAARVVILSFQTKFIRFHAPHKVWTIGLLESKLAQQSSAMVRRK
jgi:hypothetical protein